MKNLDIWSAYSNSILYSAIYVKFCLLDFQTADKEARWWGQFSTAAQLASPTFDINISMETEQPVEVEGRG